jgi:hypothetical protein
MTPTITILAAGAARSSQTPFASQMQNFIIPARRTTKFGFASHT